MPASRPKRAPSLARKDGFGRHPEKRAEIGLVDPPGRASMALVVDHRGMIDFSGVWSKLALKLEGWLEGVVVMLPNAVLSLLVVFVSAWVARWVERGVRGILLRVSSNRPISRLLGTAARVTVILLGVFVALGMMRLDKTVTSLLAGIGVVGIALGFAFQDIAANFMSGFIVALRRPFDVGDMVEVNGRLGRIKAIELRATELETLDGLSVLVPNRDVFQHAIVNFTKTPCRRLELSVGTAYADDMEKVRAVVIEALQDVPKRDLDRDVEVFFESFGDSSIDFLVHIWLSASDQPSWLHARSEAMIAIKKAFDRKGITIPFPIRTLDFGAKVVGGERIDAMTLRVASTNGP
jgi:small conductance mechanosensitive channel